MATSVNFGGSVKGTSAGIDEFASSSKNSKKTLIKGAAAMIGTAVNKQKKKNTIVDDTEQGKYEQIFLNLFVPFL
jgi:hypothetical protein